MSTEQTLQKREEKKDLCLKVVKQLNILTNALLDMSDGETESSVCRKYNLNKHNFRRIIFNSDMYFEDNPNDDSTACPVDKDILYNGGERLYSALTDCKLKNVPYDADKTGEYCLNHSCLTKKEISILRMIYWENLTLEETAKYFGVKMERIRQIRVHAVRKIRKKNYKLLRYGGDIKNYLKCRQLENLLEEKKNHLKYNQTLRENIKEVQDEIIPVDMDDKHMLLGTNIVEYLKNKTATSRLVNCFDRGSIDREPTKDMMVVEVIRKRGKWVRIRNLGQRSIKELEAYLREDGLIS